VKGLSPGTDIISYTISNSCKADTATYDIVVMNASEVYIPNLFTPDDTHNNIFYVRGNTSNSVELWIYSPWGNRIFDRKGMVDNSADGWNGTYNGKPQPTGVYLYVAKLTLQNGTTVTKKGSITLIR
jgi:gliding motility-associated-like protein